MKKCIKSNFKSAHQIKWSEDLD